MNELVKLTPTGSMINILEKHLKDTPLAAVPGEGRAELTMQVTYYSNTLANCAYTLVSGFSAASLCLRVLQASPDEKAEVKRRSQGSWNPIPGGGFVLRPEIQNKLMDAPELPMDDVYAAVAETLNKGNISGAFISDSFAKDTIPFGTKVFKASNFIEWLIANKYGVVVMLPPSVNPNHDQKDNLSIVQAAWWIPPLSVPRNTSWRTGIINFERLPSKEEFIARVEPKAKVKVHMPFFNIDQEIPHAEAFKEA